MMGQAASCVIFSLDFVDSSLIHEVGWSLVPLLIVVWPFVVLALLDGPHVLNVREIPLVGVEFGSHAALLTKVSKGKVEPKVGSDLLNGPRMGTYMSTFQCNLACFRPSLEEDCNTPRMIKPQVVSVSSLTMLGGEDPFQEQDSAKGKLEDTMAIVGSSLEFLGSRGHSTREDAAVEEAPDLAAG